MLTGDNVYNIYLFFFFKNRNLFSIHLCIDILVYVKYVINTIAYFIYFVIFVCLVPTSYLYNSKPIADYNICIMYDILLPGFSEKGNELSYYFLTRLSLYSV